jgi:hypothetical protein
MAHFRGVEEPGWVDWYDTVTSQHLLDYQHHAYQHYLETLRAEVERMLADEC